MSFLARLVIEIFRANAVKFENILSEPRLPGFKDFPDCSYNVGSTLTVAELPHKLGA